MNLFSIYLNVARIVVSGTSRHLRVKYPILRKQGSLQNNPRNPSEFFPHLSGYECVGSRPGNECAETRER